MSEYMERHAVARLIGAPPGYVGYWRIVWKSGPGFPPERCASVRATGKEYQVWDSDLPAFAVRVEASGATN
ncbi:hypothetical protein DC522_27020 [Microvirga sp. KLBC 81]|nr:hypothetical protein DC522_27020 [Microvirga sp. KLBC 81]